MQKLTTTLTALALSLALAACGGGQATPASDTPAAASASSNSSASAATAERAPEEPTAEPAEPSAEQDPSEILGQVLDPELTAERLDTFQSYRLSTTNVQIVRNERGVSETASSFTEERINAPLTIRTIVASDPTAPPNETYVNNGTLYQMLGAASERRCETTVINSEMMELSIDMARSMAGMGLIFAASSTPELVARGETVNGLLTDRYRSQSDSSGMSIEADMWIAQAGFLVKAESKTLLSDPSTGNGVETAFSYNLEVDTLAPIELPAICAAPSELASADVPLLADAENKLITDEMINYSSSTPIVDAAAFYREQLSAEGYTVDTTLEQEQNIMLKAEHADRVLEITIGGGGDSPTVVLISITTP